jgi:hypothetical protein
MKSRKTSAVAALLVSLLTAPANAATRIYVAKSNNGAVHYYDAESLRRSGNQVTVWTKTDYSQDRTTEWREDKTRVKYDCAERSYANLDMVVYHPSGKVEIVNAPKPERPLQSIVPDSVSESKMEAVCAR